MDCRSGQDTRTNLGAGARLGVRFGAISRCLCLSICLCLGFGLVAACASADSDAKTDEEKLMYFLGVASSKNLLYLDLSEAETEMLLKGLEDALAGNAEELDHSVYMPKLQALAQERKQLAIEKEKVASQRFLEEAKNTEGAKVTESGLILVELRPGSGEKPSPTDTVKVHYHGTLRDGTVFDSSVQRNQPAEFPLDRVIPCWTEGLVMMNVGSKVKLICPSEIAYGDRGSPPNISGGAALTFEVELLEIVEK